MSTTTTSGVGSDADEELETEIRPGRRSRRSARSSGRRARKRQARRDKPRKPPRERRRRWPWFVALAVVLALIGGAVYAVFFSPVLGV